MTEENMSDSQSNKSLPSFSSSSCEESNNPTGNVSAKISIPSSGNTVTVNGTVVTAAGSGSINEDNDGSGIGEGQSTSSSNENHQQTVTIVTATVATTTVQSTSNTTKTVVKQRGEKLINLQRVAGGSAPSHRVHLSGPVKQTSGPAAIMTAGSGRSSVSSLASSSAGTTTSSSASCCCNIGIPPLQNQQSLNQALAVVANKWDREQRVQDQENTRRLTLLKQRKISAILKVETLQKSLKSTSLGSMGGSTGSISGNDPQNVYLSPSVQNQLVQVKELEEEVAAVDHEMTKLGEEREHNLSELNQKRVQHVTTLQQMGLLGDSLSCSIDDPYGAGRWRSEVDLKGGNNGITSPRASSASGPSSSNQNNDDVSRKITPPVAAVLASSRIRSGSDPSLASLFCENVESNPGYYVSGNSQDENRKPSTQSTGSGKNRSLVGKSAGASPKTTGRRNPLRMLSNAIDFRVRTKKLMSQHQSRKNDGSADSKSSGRLSSLDFGRNRPKSADFERVGTINENPGGTNDEEPRQVPISTSSVDLGSSWGHAGLQIHHENNNNKTSSNTLQLHCNPKPLYYSSAISLTAPPPASAETNLEYNCGHRQISTEQINMLVTPDTFPLNAISPTSPRTPSHGVSPTSLASRLLNGASFSPFSLATSRHSLPNLDPDDMEDALNQAKLSPYTTNPRRKGGRNKHHHNGGKHNSKQLPSLNLPSNKLAMMTHTNSDPVPEETNHLKSAITNSPPTSTTSMIIHHGVNEGNLSHQLYSPNYVHPPPLENRNSAPEIVVLSPGRELPTIPIQAEEHQISQNSSKMYGVEDRSHRSKTKLFQNGGFFRTNGSKDSNYYVDEDVATQLAPPMYQSAATSIPPGPSSTGSGHVRQKLSTRFHSAQKLNYKLAALSSFASAASANINVRRSRTFNISDVHEQLNVVGNGGCGNIYDTTNGSITNASYYTKTLPKQMKTSNGSSSRKTQTLRKQQPMTLTVTAGARDSNSSSSSGVFCGSYSSSDITTTTTGSSNGTDSVGDLGSGASSTASSRKSSNSSSKDETTIEENGTEVRTDISENALQEIAAFESFIASYVVQQTTEQTHQPHCSLSSTKLSCSTGCGGKSCCMALSGSRTMGANMKCQGVKSQLALPFSTPNKAGIPPSGSRGRRMIATGGVVRTLERQKKITSMSSQTSEDA